jgi:phage terminase small subunit
VSKKKSALNIKQQLFVKHYLMSFNAKQAAIAAGYSEKTAEQQGARLLSNVKVEKLINDEMARLRERMSEEANKIYAALWQEINELADLIGAHYQAQKAIKSLNKDKHALLFGSKLDNEEQIDNPPRGLSLDFVTIQDLKEQLREINFKLQEARLDILGNKDFLRAQELRAKLLHDLFDRAGYKPTDKIDLNQNISGGLDLSYMTDEELEKEAAKLG